MLNIAVLACRLNMVIQAGMTESGLSPVALLLLWGNWTTILKEGDQTFL